MLSMFADRLLRRALPMGAAPGGAVSERSVQTRIGDRRFEIGSGDVP